jgi:hypothetical protein
VGLVAQAIGVAEALARHVICRAGAAGRRRGGRQRHTARRARSARGKGG